MKQEHIDYECLKEMEKEMGCTFCNDGIFAEMSLELEHYCEKTCPINDIHFGFYHGNIDDIKEIVVLVDESWCQYFINESSIFCGYIGDKVVSFCIVNTEAKCIISRQGTRVGSIGCVGTVSDYRGLGIGIRMVDLATLYLKGEGCDKAYISYTHIEKWYEKLGYETFARFSFL